MKLGKLAPKRNRKTLSFAAYLKSPVLPTPPEKNYWEYKVPPSTIGMYGNDTVGDCTIAEVAHDLILKTAHAGTPFFPDPAEVLKMYSAISGYDPNQMDGDGNNPTDTGCAITDVLEYMVTTGLQGYKYDGWAAIDSSNRAHRSLGVYLFGGVNVGVQLPSAAQQQFSDNETWEPVANDSIEGGHCILQSGYGLEGDNFETWGKGDQKATKEWSDQYIDEAYVVLSKDWISKANDLAPNALNYDALVADLAALKS